MGPVHGLMRYGGLFQLSAWYCADGVRSAARSDVCVCSEIVRSVCYLAIAIEHRPRPREVRRRVYYNTSAS